MIVNAPYICTSSSVRVAPGSDTNIARYSTQLSLLELPSGYLYCAFGWFPLVAMGYKNSFANEGDYVAVTFVLKDAYVISLHM